MALGEAFDAVLAAAKTGEAWAWSQLYADLAGPVEGYVKARGAPDPEDTAAEAFAGIARGIQGFSGGESEFRSWVFVIAHRRAQDARRAAGRDKSRVTQDGRTPDRPSPDDAAAPVLAEEIAPELERALAELTVAQRDVVLLRVIGGLTTEQVAKVVGRTPGAVRVQLARGLARLREVLGDEA